jgi:hypothetical protein
MAVAALPAQALDGRSLAAVMDHHGLMKLRADMQAAGYKPRRMDPSQRAGELSPLGY